MKRNLLILVPPRGIPIKVIRIPLVVLIALLICAGLGIYGYFIPFTRASLNDIERIQKKNLSHQNNKLQAVVPAMANLSNALRHQIDQLEQQAGQVKGLNPRDSRSPKDSKRAALHIAAMTPQRLKEMANQGEKQIVAVGASLKNNRDYLNAIPLACPLNQPYTTSRHFGKTTDPFTNTTKVHQGLDLVPGDEQAPVLATANGTVSKIENSPIWGRRIVVSHQYGFVTVYAHLQSVATAGGRTVTKGDTIGYSGMSGIVTGPHLHYEIIHNGKAVNPGDYLFPDMQSVFAAASNQSR